MYGETSDELAASSDKLLTSSRDRVAAYRHNPSPRSILARSSDRLLAAPTAGIAAPSLEPGIHRRRDGGRAIRFD